MDYDFDFLDEYEELDEESELYLIERLINKIKVVNYKGKPAEVVGFAQGKVLLRQDGRNLATDPEKVKLASIDDCQNKL